MMKTKGMNDTNTMEIMNHQEGEGGGQAVITNNKFQKLKNSMHNVLAKTTTRMKNQNNPTTNSDVDNNNSHNAHDDLKKNQDTLINSDGSERTATTTPIIDSFSFNNSYSWNNSGSCNVMSDSSSSGRGINETTTGSSSCTSPFVVKFQSTASRRLWQLGGLRNHNKNNLKCIVSDGSSDDESNVQKRSVQHNNNSSDDDDDDDDDIYDELLGGLGNSQQQQQIISMDDDVDEDDDIEDSMNDSNSPFVIHYGLEDGGDGTVWCLIDSSTTSSNKDSNAKTTIDPLLSSVNNNNKNDIDVSTGHLELNIVSIQEHVQLLKEEINQSHNNNNKDETSEPLSSSSSLRRREPTYSRQDKMSISRRQDNSRRHHNNNVSSDASMTSKRSSTSTSTTTKKKIDKQEENVIDDASNPSKLESTEKNGEDSITTKDNKLRKPTSSSTSTGTTKKKNDKQEDNVIDDASNSLKLESIEKNGGDSSTTKDNKFRKPTLPSSSTSISTTKKKNDKQEENVIDNASNSSKLESIEKNGGDSITTKDNKLRKPTSSSTSTSTTKKKIDKLEENVIDNASNSKLESIKKNGGDSTTKGNKIRKPTSREQSNVLLEEEDDDPLLSNDNAPTTSQSSTLTMSTSSRRVHPRRHHQASLPDLHRNKVVPSSSSSIVSKSSNSLKISSEKRKESSRNKFMDSSSSSRGVGSSRRTSTFVLESKDHVMIDRSSRRTNRHIRCEYGNNEDSERRSAAVLESSSKDHVINDKPSRRTSVLENNNDRVLSDKYHALLASKHTSRIIDETKKTTSSKMLEDSSESEYDLSRNNHRESITISNLAELHNSSTGGYLQQSHNNNNSSSRQRVEFNFDPKNLSQVLMNDSNINIKNYNKSESSSRPRRINPISNSIRGSIALLNNHRDNNLGTSLDNNSEQHETTTTDQVVPLSMIQTMMIDSSNRGVSSKAPTRLLTDSSLRPTIPPISSRNHVQGNSVRRESGNHRDLLGSFDVSKLEPEVVPLSMIKAVVDNNSRGKKPSTRRITTSPPSRQHVIGGDSSDLMDEGLLQTSSRLKYTNREKSGLPNIGAYDYEQGRLNSNINNNNSSMIRSSYENTSNSGPTMKWVDERAIPSKSISNNNNNKNNNNEKLGSTKLLTTEPTLKKISLEK